MHSTYITPGVQTRPRGAPTQFTRKESLFREKVRGKTLLRAMIIKFISKQLPVRDARKGMIYECVLECVGDMGGRGGGYGADRTEIGNVQRSADVGFTL